MRRSVIVGMSGGVDSSVTAAILKKRGYRVIGITMQLLSEQEESRCCNVSDVTDAKRVCQHLNIPHYTLNSRDLFKSSVIDPFVDSYLQGETPNPCVNCNRFIKFTALLKQADALGIQYVATGHYCKKTYNPKLNQYYLKKAADDAKDQTYFLYMLPQNVLKRLLFPLGNFEKPEIRQLATQYNLITAEKKDSQDICFVQQYKPFIESHSTPEQRKSGAIVDTTGKYLGDHQGLYKYTIGQRRGLNLGTETPYYVVAIQPQYNRLVVSPVRVQNYRIHLHTVNFINTGDPNYEYNYSIKTRYQMNPVNAKITAYNNLNNTAIITLDTPTYASAPGQSLVLYQGDRVVGGGVIQASQHAV